MTPLRLLTILLCIAGPPPASAQDTPQARTAIEGRIAPLVNKLAAACPLVDPGSQAAFDACRLALFRDPDLRGALNAILLWGRPSPTPGATLKDTTLTQFAPEVWTGLYAPLFMFGGKWSIEYDSTEKLYKVRLDALFRNALAPGQYPYPFWHDARKWNDYQTANTVMLWARPGSGAFVAAQFLNDGTPNPALTSVPHAPPVFDGKWMWTGADGVTQPQPALFKGLFSSANPWMDKLEPSYRDLANAMRDGHCNDCHVPNNPSKMKRLVLLQTPAHAASEIKRVMDSVRGNKMPVDDLNLFQEMDETTKAALLKYGSAFEAVIDSARAWEKEHTARP